MRYEIGPKERPENKRTVEIVEGVSLTFSDGMKMIFRTEHISEDRWVRWGDGWVNMGSASMRELPPRIEYGPDPRPRWKRIWHRIWPLW